MGLDGESRPQGENQGWFESAADQYNNHGGSLDWITPARNNMK